MLNEIYLSEECCKKVGADYRYPEQHKVLTLEPSRALTLRHDWDSKHVATFQTFIVAERTMCLSPVWVTLDGDAEGCHSRGWYKVLNPPNTRFFVTTDIDVELLRKQRNFLLDLCHVSTNEQGKLLDGLIAMCDHMLDEAELSGK